MKHTANGRPAEFFVVLADQADLSLAATCKRRPRRGAIYSTLIKEAKTRGDQSFNGCGNADWRYSFYIVNTILVKGTREVAEALAARPDVARVEGNPVIHNNLPQPVLLLRRLRPFYVRRRSSRASITLTHPVWALGFTGQNIVVGSADSGVRWTHDALKPHYRGWDGQNADHDYNWHDAIHDSVNNPCGNDSTFPCDDNGHGSLTPPGR